MNSFAISIKDYEIYKKKKALPITGGMAKLGLK